MEMPQNLEVVTAAMKAFVRVHKRCRDTGRTEERPTSPREWIESRDTGTSSLTICSIITGFPNPHGRCDIPHDPQDFGRCYRLLKLFPQWRPLLPQVAEKEPDWIPFVREWDRLTEMYEKAMESDDGREMYAFMKGLRA